jgi:hypothetical protein
LFEAVLDAMELDFQQRLLTAYESDPDAWNGALRALDVFLDECSDTDYGRVVFVEGPVALGWPRWRECEEKYGYRLTEAMVAALMDAGYLERGPLGPTATVAFGMLGHVGLSLAEADESERARLKADYRAVMHRFLEGLRPRDGSARSRLRRRK